MLDYIILVRVLDGNHNADHPQNASKGADVFEAFGYEEMKLVIRC